jgi:poly-D-alanine transfer protein DltD
MGIDSAFYVNNCIGKMPFPFEPIPQAKNQELKDFEALLNYLKMEKYKALFVMLPVNSLTCNCKPFANFQKNIDNLVEKNHFNYLNLFVSDSTKYELGTCVDGAHTGPLSWIEINKKIMQTFYPNEIRK